MKTTLLTLLCLTAATAAASEPPTTRCMQAHYQPDWGVVQVVSEDVGSSDLGTGIAVARLPENRMVFLTCNHCVEGQRVRVQARGVDSEATVLARDVNRDVAVIEAELPDGHPMTVVRLAQNQIAPREPLHWDGFSPAEQQYRRYDSPGETMTQAYIWSRGVLQDGMSGGPVLNDRSEVAGMIVAKGRHENWGLAASASELRTILATSLDSERLPYVARAQSLRSFPEGGPVNPIGPPKADEWAAVSYRVKANTLFK